MKWALRIAGVFTGVTIATAVIVIGLATGWIMPGQHVSVETAVFWSMLWLVIVIGVTALADMAWRWCSE